MSHSCLSPVAIDLGAINTGVYLFQMLDGNFSDALKQGLLVRLDPEKITLTQVNRRAKRHQRRCYARRKLAKRLLKVIFEKKYGASFADLPRNTLEFINGLANRRGYTFLGFDELDIEGINILDNSQLGEWFPDFFAGSTVAPTERLQMITSDLEFCSKLSRQIDQFLNTQKDTTHPLAGLDKDIRKIVIAALNTMRAAINSTLKSERDGHYHRREFFENIRKDILDFNDILQPFYLATGLNSEDLFRITAHTSNLQLRILRKYFNDPAMKNNGDYWDDNRFKNLYKRYARGWHARKDKTVAENRKHILSSLETRDTLSLWRSNHPESTIPPFEDQNNRRPPVCHSLIFDETHLDAQYKSWRDTVRILAKQLFPNFSIDRNFESICLQRLLDCSSATDYYCIRGLSEGRNETRLKKEVYDARLQELSQKLGQNSTDELLKLAKQYFYESEIAASGDWHSEIPARLLKKCGKHPPRKEKQLDKILSSMLRIELDEQMLEDFRVFFGKHKFKGNSTCKTIAEKAARAQKDYGASLKSMLEKGKDTELQNLQSNIELAGAALEKHIIQNYAKPSQASTYENRFSDVFIFAQIFNLLYQDIQGFSSTCRVCTIENAWRSLKSDTDDNHANGRRLPADSIRPFDGILARSMELIASAIAKEKVKQLLELPDDVNVVDIPVGIEANSFEFSSELGEMKKQQIKKKLDEKLEARAIEQLTFSNEKFERIKADSRGICPYTGERLSDFGHLDHIIPRSYTRDRYRAVFNSEANLVFCSVVGNNRKGDRDYSLSELADNYLLSVFNTKDREWLKEHIKSEITRLQNTRTRFSALDQLSYEERQCVRHALFIEELRSELLPDLNQQNKTRVNGTQKYFLSILRKKIDSALKNKRAGIQLNFKCERVANTAISRYRNTLAQLDPKAKKTIPQSAFSHVIDATMLFAAQSASGFNKSPDNITPAEDPTFLKELLPANLEIKNLVRRPVFKTMAWHQTLFKDTIYGTHFLPFIVDYEGKAGFGYDQQNCVYLKKNQAKVFDTLKPFFRKQAALFSEVQKQAITEKKCILFTFDKNRIFELLLEVAKKEVPSEKNFQAQIFESVLYQSQKVAVNKRLFDTTRKKLCVKTDILKDNIFITSIKLPDGLGNNNNFSLPFKHAWEKLLEQGFVSSKLGQKLEADELADFDKKIEKYFLNEVIRSGFARRMAERNHARARRVFSLPEKQSASGAFIIKRKTPSGHVWQVVASEQAYEGFSRNSGKFGDPLLLATLRDAKNTFSLGSRYTDKKSTGKIHLMDEWRVIEKNIDLPDSVKCLEVRPGTAPRRYARITMMEEDFLRLIYPCLESTEGDLPHILSLKPVYNIKKNSADFKKALPGLGCPRSYIFLETIGKEVRFVFEAGGMSTKIANLYFSN